MFARSWHELRSFFTRARSRQPPTSGIQLRAHTALREQQNSGRVLHHVRSGRWQADEQIVSSATLGQLLRVRDELIGAAEAGCSVVRVTSGLAGRTSKAHVAAQLAWELAEDRRVLLVEADLDGPTLHRVLEVNVPRGFGLSEQLERAERCDAAESCPSLTRIRLGKRLDALLESAFGSPQLFNSQLFSALLAQERAEHDFVVLNSPIVGDWPDAEAVRESTDNMVFISPSPKVEVRALLDNAPEHFATHATLSVIDLGARAGSEPLARSP